MKRFSFVFVFVLVCSLGSLVSAQKPLQPRGELTLEGWWEIGEKWGDVVNLNFEFDAEHTSTTSGLAAQSTAAIDCFIQLGNFVDAILQGGNRIYSIEISISDGDSGEIDEGLWLGNWYIQGKIQIFVPNDRQLPESDTVEIID